MKNLKDSIEVRHPGSDRVFIVSRIENARDSTLFAQFDDAPMDLRNNPEIDGVVSKSGTVRTSTGWSYVVNWSIASNTDRVS